MVKLLFSLLCLILCANAHSESLSDGIKHLPKEEWVWQSLHVIDTAQTISIAQNPDKFREKNPLLGKHPSVESVVAWSITASVIHAGVAYGLQKTNTNPKFVKVYEYVSIGLKANTVFVNFKIGLP